LSIAVATGFLMTMLVVPGMASARYPCLPYPACTKPSYGYLTVNLLVSFTDPTIHGSGNNEEICVSWVHSSIYNNMPNTTAYGSGGPCASYALGQSFFPPDDDYDIVCYQPEDGCTPPPTNDCMAPPYGVGAGDNGCLLNEGFDYYPGYGYQVAGHSIGVPMVHFSSFVWGGQTPYTYFWGAAYAWDGGPNSNQSNSVTPPSWSWPSYSYSYDLYVELCVTPAVGSEVCAIVTIVVG
jgi:hypothetical protein